MHTQDLAFPLLRTVCLSRALSNTEVDCLRLCLSFSAFLYLSDVHVDWVPDPLPYGRPCGVMKPRGGPAGCSQSRAGGATLGSQQHQQERRGPRPSSEKSPCVSSVSREGWLGSQSEGGPPGLGAEVASSTGALEGQDLRPETPGAETGLFSAVWVPTLAGQEGPRPMHGRQAGRLLASVSSCGACSSPPSVRHPNHASLKYRCTHSFVLTRHWSRDSGCQNGCQCLCGPREPLYGLQTASCLLGPHVAFPGVQCAWGQRRKRKPRRKDRGMEAGGDSRVSSSSSRRHSLAGSGVAL